MEYFLKASAVLIIFYICYRILLQRDTFFQSNRWFLLTGFFIAICIPYLAIPIYVEYTPKQITSSIIAGNISIASQDNIEPTVDLITLLTWVYLSGLIFFTVRFFIEISSLTQVIYSGTREKVGKYNFVKTPSQMPPFSFFNWIVFNPKHFNEKELELIINHEKIHANQWHSIDIILSQLITIIFWFNPIVWLYKKSLQQNLEYIADYNAQNISSCNSSYQKLLLKTSVKGLKLSLVNNFYSSLIKKRIVMLHKNRSKKNNQWKPLLVLPLLAIFLMSFNTKTIYIEKEDIPKSSSFFGDYSLSMNEAYLKHLTEEAAQKAITKTTPKAEKKTAKKSTPLVKGNNIKKDVALSEVVTITKDFSDADFDNLKAELSKKGITIKFKGIKRNKSGEITAINITAKSENSEVKYSSKDDDPIDPITIKIDKNNISIGDSWKHKFTEGYAYRVTDKKHKKHKSKGGNVFFYSDDEDDDHNVDIIITDDGKKHKIKSNSFTYRVHSDDEHDGDHEKEVIVIRDKDSDEEVKEIIIKGGAKVWTTDEDVTYGRIGKGKGNYFFFSGDNDGKEPFFIMDGKEISRKDLEDIDSDDIEKIEVLKGDKAVEKYGDKAKNGVVVIYTKKE